VVYLDSMLRDFPGGPRRRASAEIAASITTESARLLQRYMSNVSGETSYVSGASWSDLYIQAAWARMRDR
jgi:hypothetical protein